jgi:hypothetical protein
VQDVLSEGCQNQARVGGSLNYEWKIRCSFATRHISRLTRNSSIDSTSESSVRSNPLSINSGRRGYFYFFSKDSPRPDAPKN